MTALDATSGGHEPRARVVGICGAGTMGAGIAQLCLQTGHEVVLYDVDEAAIERGRTRIAAGLAHQVERGRLPAERRDALVSTGIRDAHDLATLADESEIVVEAALEDLELKRTLFAALDAGSAPDALLATNTSALSVGAIASATRHPERVIGLHFFNPAPVMPLVEVVAARSSAGWAVDAGVAFADELGRTPIVCRDAPGFIVNRVNRPFTLEALRLLEAGRATLEQVDAALEAAGYRMGPFRLMDLTGVDVNLAVARSLFAAFGEDARFRPTAIQSEMVEAGELGRKTGRGFYLYDGEGRPRGPNPTVAGRVAGADAPPVADEAIVERIELAIINEAYHAVGEDVAAPDDIDRAMKLGANHPHGPFERAGQLGLRHVLEGLERLGREPGGERFRPARALWGVATL